MKTKRLFKGLAASFLLLLVGGNAVAQQQHYTSEPSLAEQMKLVKAKQDKFNFFLNMNMSADALFDSDGFQKGIFNGRQLRIEAKGNITPWLSYRWRQRLNRGNSGGGNIDNLPTSIDIAGIGVSPSDKFSMFFGKQCAAYGGIEFDLNPIEIYEYCDMIEYMSNFLTGVNFSFNPTPTQQIQLQILNGRNGSYLGTYPSMDQGGKLKYEEAKLPWVYTLNWNGTIAPFWSTRWSYSLMSQADSKQMHYVALGNLFDFGRMGGYFDAMYSKEGLNRKMIIGSTEDVEYLSFVLKLNYRLQKEWNLFVKGMYETAGHSEDGGWFSGKTERTALGYLAGLEYYPLENSNLHFFLTYIGRHYDFNKDHTYNTNRIALGFIYQLPMF